jgi:hypothetical protein
VGREGIRWNSRPKSDLNMSKLHEERRMDFAGCASAETTAARNGANSAHAPHFDTARTEGALIISVFEKWEISGKNADISLGV